MNNSTKSQPNIYLVTGATGNVGRHVVNKLIQKGHRVRALTRTPSKANFSDQIEVIAGDLNKPETLIPALKGVTGVHLITTIGDGFEPLQTGPEIVKIAEKAEVQRVTVLWSGLEGPVEQAVKASSLEWTILQPQEFMSNVFEWTETIRKEGVVREAFGNRLTAMIHEADIGRVAATTLTEEGHAGKEYTLTGPEALTLVEVVRTISKTIGREIRFEELTEEQALERMLKSGFEKEAAEFILSWYKNTPPEGYTAVPTVEEITGRPARTFDEWVAENADRFRAPSDVSSESKDL